MRTFFVFICSLALVCAVRGDTKKTHAQSSKPASSGGKPAASGGGHVQHTQAPQHKPANVEHPTQNNTQVHTQAPPQHVAPARVHSEQVPAGRHPAQMRQSGHSPPQQGHLQPATAVRPAAPTLTKEQQAEVHAQNEGFRNAEQYRQWRETGRVEAPAMSGALSSQRRMKTPTSGIYRSPKTPATFTQRHYDLPKTPVPDKDKVTFEPGRHIPGCHNWKDSKHDVFRNYTPEWREKNWWLTHHRRIVVVCGGWYYWNAGYWFPAWGYHSDAVYAYDGPIYAYHNLLPDQVIANIQAALQELGYYTGPIDGVLGLPTRDAIANYQRDHELYTTSAIDEPTLEALGMS